MSQLGSVLQEQQESDRRRGIRILLRTPLLLARANREAFETVVRERGWLTEWFREQAGWKLVVHPSGGFARLLKVPARRDETRGATVNGRVFDKRRYTLFCLALMALDDGPAQTTLARLAEMVEELSAEEDEIPPFDPSLRAERQALVDALRLLLELGVIRLRDGDAERYGDDRGGDALFDVEERLLGQLVSTPLPPGFTQDVDRMLEEAFPETEEGARLRARTHAFRRLLEDPVVYFEDLPEEVFRWLDHARGFVYDRLERDVGLATERRREGMAAVDPKGWLTDQKFPDGGSTVRHAALLLAAELAKLPEGEREAVDPGALVAQTFELQQTYGASWSKRFTEDVNGIASLCEEALGVLEAFGLVARNPEGTWRARPAIARFRPALPGASRR